MLSAVAPIEIWDPPGNGGCAPASPATRFGPETPQRSPKLKRKKQSIMENGVLHSKHQKRAKPTPLPPLSCWWERNGGGSPSPPPPRALPHLTTPKSPRNLHSSREEKGVFSHELPGTPQLHSSTWLFSSLACSIPSRVQSHAEPYSLHDVLTTLPVSVNGNCQGLEFYEIHSQVILVAWSYYIMAEFILCS